MKDRATPCELLDNLLSSLSAEASTHNEFIKRCEAAVPSLPPSSIKRWEKQGVEGGNGRHRIYLFIVIASHMDG